MNSNYPIIGMSPGNSYFKDGVVKELLKIVVEKYGKAAVFVADIPAIHTYVALGYPENRARRDKALPQGNALKNRVKRAMEELGYNESQVKIIDWESEVKNNTDFIQKYEEVIKLYSENKEFERAANETTRTVLEKTAESMVSYEVVRIGVHYLLNELAFLEFVPQFLESQKVIYIYHKPWPVYDSYRKGEFDGKPRTYLDFEIVT